MNTKTAIIIPWSRCMFREYTIPSPGTDSYPVPQMRIIEKNNGARLGMVKIWVNFSLSFPSRVRSVLIIDDWV